jgi:hypothetical protein
MRGRPPWGWVTVCLGLAVVMYFFSIVSEGAENCGDSCASQASIAAMRWVAVGLVVAAIGFATVAVVRPRPPHTVRMHCYACGTTTEVRSDRIAADLDAAGWVSDRGRTFCPECAAVTTSSAAAPGE